MEFTYTPNYGKIDYKEFTWLTGEYDPNNMYALDDRGKEYEKYVENLDQHGIWFILSPSLYTFAHTLFLDNYGNIWIQQSVGLKDRGLILNRCPVKQKQKEQRISTEKLPDQFINWIIKNKSRFDDNRLKACSLSIYNIHDYYETFKQQINDVKDGINDFIKLLREKAKATETQIDEFRKNMAKLKNGTLKYELIPKLDINRKLPQELLGLHYVIGQPMYHDGNKKLDFILLDERGQLWTLGEEVPLGPFEEIRDPCIRVRSGETPRLQGEKHKYPLANILNPFISNILKKEAYQIDMYNTTFLQPLAKYLFDNYAPENIKHDYLEAERLEQEEIKRKEDEKKRAEEAAKQKAIDQENRRIKEARRIKEEQDAAAEKKRIEEEIKTKEIAKAQAELREVQNRLNKLLSQ